MPERERASAVPDAPTAADALKNLALELALAWGKGWLQPIQNRLAVAAPELDPAQLDALNALAQRAMRAGWTAMEGLLRIRQGVPVVPDLDDFRVALGPDFSWIDASRLSRLHSQSAYYALR